MADTQTKKIRLRPWLEIFCLAAAFWPIWAWYVSRTLDASDEPWGLIALATASYFLYQTRNSTAATANPTAATANPTADPANKTATNWSGIFAIGAYIALFPFAPNLVLSLLVVAALWCVFSTGRALSGRSGILGLLVISLPLIPSLNFFGGYPLRLVTAAGARLLLSCLGMSVSQQGTMLTVQDKLVAIDAPCSGISMVWASAYIAFLMAAVLKLNGKKTFILSITAGGIVIVANVLRAASLVMYDTIADYQTQIARAMPEPVVHLGVGLLIFALSAAATIMIALKLSQLNIKQQQPQPERLPMQWLQGKPLANSVLIPVCLLAAIMPFLASPSGGASTKYCPPQWPANIAGHTLTVVPSLPEENAFAKDFPGAMKRFTDGTNAYFVRVVNRETRQLHPSSDCFRGMGYAITFRPIFVDVDGNRWNTFLASKDGQSVLVMERLYDEHGHSWTDASSWYWAAALGQSKGPWWAVTMARTATESEVEATR